MDDYYDTFYRYLSDGVYQIFLDEFNRSKIIKSSYNYLQNFQIVLQQLPMWTQPVCEKKWEGICKLCGYECLEEYMKIVLVTKMKFLIEHCMEDEKEIDDMIENFKCPSKEDFLRDVVSCCARYFYQNPFLFKECNFEESQANRQKAKNIITENIKFTIQKHLPSRVIAKKCKPEELLRKKKVNYCNASSQCDSLESNNQMERYMGNHIGNQRYVFGDVPRWNQNVGMEYNYEQDYIPRRGNYPMLGAPLDRNLDDERNTVQMQNPHFNPRHPPIPNVFKVTNERPPSPEYIRHAHNMLYQGKANKEHGLEQKKSEIDSSNNSYSNQSQSQESTRENIKGQSHDDKNENSALKEDENDSSASIATSLSGNQKTPQKEPTRLGSNDSKNLQVTSSIPTSINGLASFAAKGHPSNILQPDPISPIINSQNMRQMQNFNALQTMIAQKAASHKNTMSFDRQQSPVKSEEQKKSSDIITVSVPQYALERVQSFVSDHTDEYKQDSVSSGNLDDEFSNQEQKKTQNALRRALDNDFGTNIKRTAFVPPSAESRGTNGAPKHVSDSEARNNMPINQGVARKNASGGDKVNKRLFRRQASTSESEKDSSSGSLMSVESRNEKKQSPKISNRAVELPNKAQKANSRQSAGNSKISASNNKNSRDRKGYKDPRPKKKLDVSAHTTDLSESPDLMTTEEEEQERDIARKTTQRTRLFKF